MKNGNAAIVFTRRLQVFRPFLVLILITSLQFSARAFADKKITLNLQSVELKKALSAIEKKTDYRFMYNESVIANKPKIDLDVKDADITDVLRIILTNNGIAYSILNNTLIVLRANQEQETKVIRVSGRVTGPGGTPLHGVSVTI